MHGGRSVWWLLAVVVLVLVQGASGPEVDHHGGGEDEDSPVSLTLGGCRCKPVSVDFADALNPRQWAWCCSNSGWCDVEPGCEAARDVSSDYSGWDHCEMLCPVQPPVHARQPGQNSAHGVADGEREEEGAGTRSFADADDNILSRSWVRLDLGLGSLLIPLLRTWGDAVKRELWQGLDDFRRQQQVVFLFPFGITVVVIVAWRLRTGLASEKSEKERVRMLLARAAKRMQRNRASVSLRGWYDFVQWAKRSRVVAGRVLMRRQQARLSAAYYGWYSWASASAMTKRKIAHHMRRGIAATGLHTWVDYTARRVRQRHIVQQVVARLQHSAVVQAFGRWHGLVQECCRVREGVTLLIARIGHGLAFRAFMAWLDAAAAYRAECLETDRAARYLAMCTDVEQESDEEAESAVRVLHAARESDSVISEVQNLVGADGMGARFSLSPPGSSPSEVDDYCAQSVGFPKRYMDQASVGARTPSRRVTIDNAVGNLSPVKRYHTVYVTKSSAKSRGFGIYLSNDLQVVSCAARSPAQNAGLQIGCTIVKVNDLLVRSRDDFRRFTQAVVPGDTAAFTVCL